MASSVDWQQQGFAVEFQYGYTVADKEKKFANFFSLVLARLLRPDLHSGYHVFRAEETAFRVFIDYNGRVHSKEEVQRFIRDAYRSARDLFPTTELIM